MATTKALRADGRRNRERLIEAARELVRRDGSHASLEEVARRAGVGSATLHRHFPSRQTLLEAVFRDGIAQLCAHAGAQPGTDPATELTVWLEDATAYIAGNRGLGNTLISGPDPIPPEELCATDLLVDALSPLVVRARASGALRSGVTAEDLMTLANAIGLATEGDETAARRLLRFAVNGVRS